LRNSLKMPFFWKSNTKTSTPETSG
jgi:hypothetical protein